MCQHSTLRQDLVSFSPKRNLVQASKHSFDRNRCAALETEVKILNKKVNQLQRREAGAVADMHKRARDLQEKFVHRLQVVF